MEEADKMVIGMPCIPADNAGVERKYIQHLKARSKNTIHLKVFYSTFASFPADQISELSLDALY